MNERDARALAVYEWLRTANPHLPEPVKVGREGVSITIDPLGLSTVTLTVIVDLPAIPQPEAAQ